MKTKQDARRRATRRRGDPTPPHRLAAARVLVIGGDDRIHAFVAPYGAASIPSSRFGGPSGIRRALAAVDAGQVERVVFLCRWLGHSDQHTIAARCRARGVPITRIHGGLSALRAELRAPRPS